MKEIHDLMGIQATTRHDKYIGLLMLVGRSKASTFNSIKKKVDEEAPGVERKHAFKGGERNIDKIHGSSHTHIHDVLLQNS